ncbi:DNA-formamidopyrimidine glycosylase family protein [Galactobacter valiniphilus]|uniref:DNA-formamidopyrimidine glycosylase family protein n=1 Tax=Galactobacter valiniphilus TaxID=2676122 RepID=UPI003736516E
MPEGDSLARVERRLRPLLLDTPLLRSDFRVPAMATLDLRGRSITEVSAYGKHLFLRVDGGDVIHSHLLMEGRWRVLAPDERWRVPASSVRVVLETERAQVLGVQLGVLEAMTQVERERLVASLGPDPIHAWEPEVALALLRADPHRQIGAALLDQRIIAGIGNVFRSEVLFAARLSPFVAVGEASASVLTRLIDIAGDQLQANAGRASRRTTGPASRERYWVYGRAGRPCPRSHATVLGATLADPQLARDFVGGDSRDLRSVARDVFWCPRCQPGPVPDGAASPRAGGPAFRPGRDRRAR